MPDACVQPPSPYRIACAQPPLPCRIACAQSARNDTGNRGRPYTGKPLSDVSPAIISGAKKIFHPQNILYEKT